MTRAGAVLACVLAAGCRADAGQRRETLASAGQANQGLAAGQVATLLRAPTDSFRVIYSRPTNLMKPCAAPTLSAPPGAAAPDSGRAAGAPTGGTGTTQPPAASAQPGAAGAQPCPPAPAAAPGAPPSAGAAAPTGARPTNASGTARDTSRKR